MQRKLTIAIDGPAGAGKSTVAQALARRLGYVNLESGAMYRALALKAIESGTPLDDEAALLALAQQSHIELVPTGQGNQVLLDGRDVSQRIREKDVTDAASRSSVYPAVRVWMVDRQREMGTGGGVIMEGRDIGTKVFPNAEVKIFLDASPEVRAQRRFQQDLPQGPGNDKAKTSANGEDVRTVAEQIRERDERDRSRTASPLEPAADAVILDSSSLNIEQVVERVMLIVKERLANL